MPKKKKKNTKNTKKQNYLSRKRIISPPTHRGSQALGTPSGIKTQNKKLRKAILAHYQRLYNSKMVSGYETVQNFLKEYYDNLDLVRESISRYRHDSHPLSKLLWNALEQSDPQQYIAQKILSSEPIRQKQIELLSTHFSHPLLFEIPVTTHGPKWTILTSSTVESKVKPIIDKIADELFFNYSSISEEPLSIGSNTIILNFEGRLNFPITVIFEIANSLVPDDCAEAWENQKLLTFTDPQNAVFELQLQLNIPENDNVIVWNKMAIRVLKTLHTFGYWQTSWTQEVLQQWRLNNHKIAQGKFVTNAPKASEIPSNSRTSLRDTDSILDLPPLVAYDLAEVDVDINALRYLFYAPKWRNLKEIAIEAWDDIHIQNLTYGLNQELNAIRNGQYTKNPITIKPRTLALIYSSIAKLQYDRLEIGTTEKNIRMCMSSYATRIGQYLIDAHNRFDSTRDYYLDALTLNLVSRNGVDFPTRLIIISWFRESGNNLAIMNLPRKAPPAQYVEQCTRVKKNHQLFLECASRGFMEIALRKFDWAQHLFDHVDPNYQIQLLRLLGSQLGVTHPTFENCVSEYRSATESLQSSLEALPRRNSMKGLSYLVKELESRITRLGFLLNPTNQKILELLVRAANLGHSFAESDTYEKSREYVNNLKSLLKSILSYGSDKKTTLWAHYIHPIALHWIHIADKEFAERSAGIAPILSVVLARNQMTLDKRGRIRAVFKIYNNGQGAASEVKISIHEKQQILHIETIKSHSKDIEPAEVIDGYFIIPTEYQSKDLDFSYSISYLDPDNKHFERAEQPLGTVSRLPNTVTSIDNPFRTDQEVEDASMFVGREKLLTEVTSYILDKGNSGILMLHGQKRVGKSSFLTFLKNRIESRTQPDKNTIVVRVSWLDFSAHTVTQVIQEFVDAIEEEIEETLNIDQIQVPSFQEIQQSYTFAFNQLIRNLRRRHGVSRLIILIDEFDVIVKQLAGEYGFDRNFFEYLRGLSKRENTTIVLTGGELMPVLFETQGEVFNHDKTWRIAYLSNSDGSIEKLIQNKYIENKITVSNDAIGLIKLASACNPCFVQMICQQLINRAIQYRANSICRLDVKEVVESLTHQSDTGKYVRHLYNPYGDEDKLDTQEMAIIGIVAKLETEKSRPSLVKESDVLRYFEESQKNSIIGKIGELVRREILTRHPETRTLLRITLPLFRDWYIDNKPKYQSWTKHVKRSIQ